MKKNYCKLFVGLACGALLIPAGAESYVVREYLAVFLGFCALFTIFEIALLFIFALEEAGQVCLVWLGAESVWLISRNLARFRFPMTTLMELGVDVRSDYFFARRPQSVCSLSVDGNDWHNANSCKFVHE